MSFSNKLINYTNRKLLRTPGVEFLKKEIDLQKRKKYLDYWFNKVLKKKSFNKYFSKNNEKSNFYKKIRFCCTDDFTISDEMMSSLSENGVLVIENALPKDEFNLIKEYFNDLKEKKFEKKWLSKPVNPFFFSEVDEIRGLLEVDRFKILKKYSDIASKEIYEKIVKPTVELHHLRINKNLEKENKEKATYLHVDRFLPHFKIFFTPTKITENGAPFQYSLGSHKITKDYINFFINGNNFNETDLSAKPLINDLETITADENTLFIAFTNGFHKRTCFLENKQERSMLYLQYIERYNKFNYLFSN